MGGGFKKIDGPRLHLGPLALCSLHAHCCCCFSAAASWQACVRDWEEGGCCWCFRETQALCCIISLGWLLRGPPSPPYFSFFFFTHAPSAHVTMCCCTQRCRQPSWSTPTQCIHCGAQAVQSQRTGAKLTGGGLWFFSTVLSVAF